jgi:cyclase
MKRSMMACVVPCSLMIWFGAGWVTPGSAQTGVAVQKVQIAAGIYQFITAGDGYVPRGNSIVIVNEDDVLVFDTFSRPSTARTVLAEIRKITDKPVRFVVNSHWHPDHWSGNEVYAQEFPHVAIIATEETRQYMLNAASAWPSLFGRILHREQVALEKEVSTGKEDDGTPLTAEQRNKDEEYLRLKREFTAEAMTVKRTYPTLTYNEKLTLRHGGREFRFMSVVGDARGSTVLYLPTERIVVTGDVLCYPFPYVTPPLSQHAKSLRTLAQLDVDIIIPGHGPAFHDKDFLNLEAELFETVVNQVSLALQKGSVTAEEVQKEVNVEPLRLKLTHDEHNLNKEFPGFLNELIENAYREGRDGQKWGLKNDKPRPNDEGATGIVKTTTRRLR